MQSAYILITSLIVVGFSLSSQAGSYPVSHTVEVSHYNDSVCKVFVQDKRIFSERWDTLAQPIFWRKAMNLVKDSGIVNIGSTRQIVDVVSIADWNKQTTIQKQTYRDSVRMYYCLPEEEHVYMTSGKQHFYDFSDAIPSIDRAVKIFEKERTDPFFAQAILLIESPGKPKKSHVGAYGSFQLMKSVAKSMGLTVNNTVDDRKDFDKCAIGAAKLLRTVCIPELNKILNAENISYSANDLWYKLLVLHVYHAGAYNVKKAIACIPADKRCDSQIIPELWKVECGSFRNASQNYSQVALASLMQLEAIILESCDAMEATAYVER